jgi:hypothetical protein
MNSRRRVNSAVGSHVNVNNLISLNVPQTIFTIFFAIVWGHRSERPTSLEGICLAVRYARKE